MAGIKATQCNEHIGIDHDFWANASPETENKSECSSTVSGDERIGQNLMNKSKSRKSELVVSSLELAQSLFGPDTTIIKAFQKDAESNRAVLTRKNALPNFVRKVESGDVAIELRSRSDTLRRTLTDRELNDGGNLNETTTETIGEQSIMNSSRGESAMSAQASLLNRKDFTALEVLNAIYKGAPAGNPPFAKPTSTTYTYLPQQQQQKLKMQLKTRPGSDQPSHGKEDDAMSRQQRELIDQYFHQSSDPKHLRGFGAHSGQQLVDQYFEYYEYLCKGIKRALAHPGSFDLDCGAGSVHTPSNQQANGVCRAMKSNLYYQYSPGPEIYSRKVFVGGLPIDIDEDELSATFSRFGPLIVDWPNKNENKSYFPPKGYVFLIFEYEVSVRALVQSCFEEDEKLFLYISSPLSPDKLVQIRPWRLADADYVVEASIPVYARRTIFVGGVPRPIKAVELAHIMDQLYGSVACAGIDTDVEYKYPKGAGRVAFINQNSYMRAIKDRYVQLSHGEVEKRVELKPYVLDDQPCDECGGERCGHRPAPFFCPELSCLQYYCEKCWTTIHGCRARENHKPLVKEA
ncbi:hypothetical protein AB6A40_001005 [Gnathostoma spinigerum]|uniref:Cytoplasmic polyadenylation element-binding protein 1 n=1 Tax=Gnathostoma spinigerum TaxID=75299 RepID=A0ABD6E5E0_9BILA